MKKKVIVLSLGLLLFAASASAHVVVKPSQVGVGAYQTFNIGVPVEHEVPTTGLRLEIPEGLESVMPNVKPGWRVSIKTEPTGKKIEHDGEMVDEQKAVEIIWSGGSIPEGQRDDFLFSAKTPGTPTTLQWKAYQTYQDGIVVSWSMSAKDQPKDESGKNDYSKFGPYSETKVVDDLSAQTAAPAVPTKKESKTPLVVSTLAFLFSLVAMVLASKKKSA